MPRPRRPRPVAAPRRSAERQWRRHHGQDGARHSGRRFTSLRGNSLEQCGIELSKGSGGTDPLPVLLGLFLQGGEGPLEPSAPWAAYPGSNWWLISVNRASARISARREASCGKATLPLRARKAASPSKRLALRPVASEELGNEADGELGAAEAIARGAGVRSGREDGRDPVSQWIVRTDVDFPAIYPTRSIFVATLDQHSRTSILT